jgi:4-oxalomesaconate tautomerase
MMNLGDVSNQSVPKMCLVAEPSGAGNISARVFIPHVCHRSIGVLGAVTVATACLLPGSVTNGIAVVPAGSEKSIVVQHPSGTFLVRLRVDEGAPPENLIKRAGVIRTARTLMRGNVFISSSIWDGHSSASDRSGAD